MRAMRHFRQALGRLGLRLPIAALGLLAVLAAGPTGALAGGEDDPPPNRAPRVTVPIGGVNVVLVSNGDHLYAFVDHVEGNAPVENATLAVRRAGSRTPVALTEESPGLFVAPFKRAGLVQDVFTLSLSSSGGSGERTAKLLYDDAPAAAVRGGAGSFGRLLSIALVSGAIGAMGSVLLMRWWGRRSRRTEPPPLVRAT